MLSLEQEYQLDAACSGILTLWQVRCGEVITVKDSSSAWYRARVSCLSTSDDNGSAAENDDIVAKIIPFESVDNPEPPLDICVYQALPDKERFELILQKLTEIGITKIIPFVSNHSSTQQQRDAGQKKSHRWPDVILRAARQCRRGMIPELAEVQSWEAVMQQLSEWDVKLIMDVQGGSWSFSEAVAGGQPGSVAIIVGPEGGFDKCEVDQAQDYGALPVTLGSRILRTETAAIVAAALVQSLVGDYA